jgi:peptidoglycan-associated lipoprotein
MQAQQKYQITNSTRSHGQTLRVFSMLVMVAIAVGCVKKKQVEEEAVNPDASQDMAQDSSISNQPLGFDAQGSDSGTIDGLKTVFFPYDSSTLTSDARKRIQGNADWLKNNSSYNLQIEGHCDEKGSVEYNLALGERRAKSVRSYMVSLGVDANRMSVISYGEEKPLVQGDGESIMAKNRRANFLPLGQ